jgi:RNase P subunit RPR2
MELTKAEAKTREGIIEQSARDIVGGKRKVEREAVEMLKAVLEANRVRAIGGWKRDRCLACDHPHPAFKVCECPHHKAIAFLKGLGIEVEA